MENFNVKTNMLTDIDRQEISNSIKNGNTSGHLNDGENKNIYWELKINVWAIKK